MKRLCAILLVTALVLAGCGGDAREAEVKLESSTRHTDGEIQDAAQTVKAYFQREFDGCALLKLWYEDALSAKQEPGWIEQYGAERAIVLKSKFVVGENDGLGSLVPGETYDNYSWILVKTPLGWEVKTMGYG